MDVAKSGSPEAEWTEAKVVSVVDDLARFGVFTKRGPLTFSVSDEFVTKFRELVAALSKKTSETLTTEVRTGKLDTDDALDAFDYNSWGIPYMACGLLLSDYCKFDVTTPSGKELFADYVIFCHAFLTRMLQKMEPVPEYVK